MNNRRNSAFSAYEKEIRGAVACAIRSVLNRLPGTSLDAEELFSEGLLFAYQQMDRYDSKSGAVMTYLFKPVRQKVHRFALKEIRASGVMTPACSFGSAKSQDLKEDLIIRHDDPFVDAENMMDHSYEPDAAMSCDVRDMLSEFSEKDRQIIIDRFIRDIPLDEIGQKYGMSKSSADRYVKELRMTMRVRMRKYDRS